jgi:hypothetical protein
MLLRFADDWPADPDRALGEATRPIGSSVGMARPSMSMLAPHGRR